MSESFEDYGWFLCDFDGEPEECETCEKESEVIYYRRVCWEVDEGEYSCADCIRKEIELLGEWEKDHERIIQEYRDSANS